MIGPMLSSGIAPAIPAGTTALELPAPVRIGAGSARGLAAALAGLGVARPLIVTDAGLVAVGLVDAVRQPLDASELFAELSPDPTEADVSRAIERFRESGCDGLVGLGGGSAIETAKAIRRFVGGTPLVAVPTSAGPGVEALPTARIRSMETGCKRDVGGTPTLPSLTISDPSLTRSAPPALTAATGIDALSHCLEAYLAAGFHPFCDGAAIEGLRYIFRGFEAAVLDGSNAEARAAMTVGSLLGGAAARKGLGAAHALAFAVEVDAPGRHAPLVAILLPHVLRYNRQAAEPRMAELASRVGLGRAGDGPGHLITLVELLRSNAPLARKLGDLEGPSRDRIPEYARLALLDPDLASNPRECTQTSLEELLDRAW
ncbi:iron-containing alcohol dehydrogenase [Paludisphaera rhizosphaerae]|uniref:iron-containing alcohol dehydrogenase n=1 Tax=Paludisphaera rhizosphaerae TaxID=2711216 RepID=UPI0013EB36CD|nr:iron-containing alcohol dehydrogenase [Paludisphaera rhizosphaerae]